MDKRIWYWLWYSRRYVGTAANISLRGPTSPTILGAGVLGAALQWRGQAMTFADGWQGVVVAGVIYTAIAWATIFVFRLVFVVPFRLWQGGHWLGQEFVYDKPVLAIHRRVSSSDNDKVHTFKFKEAPPGSLVAYSVEVAGRNEFIAVAVGAHPNQIKGMAGHWLESGQRVGGGSVRVNRKRDMCMATSMRVEATPISVRVWITSWSY